MRLVLQSEGKSDIFDQKYPFYSIVEVASNNDPEVVPEDSERLLEFIEAIEENIHDGIVPQGEQQSRHIWDLREGIATGLSSYGYTLMYDISLSSENFYKVVEETRKVIQNSDEFSHEEKEQIITTGFGHIGDGNLHLNISLKGYGQSDLEKKVERIVEPFVMEFVKSVKGSISAEHGVGLQKSSFLEYSKSKPMIEYMQKIKEVFDPNMIMNPYKVLPNN